MNNYKYTKKKPKKIMKNMDLILNNLNEEENIRSNTETTKPIKDKKIPNLKLNKDELSRNTIKNNINNNSEKMTFSNTYSNFGFGESNANMKINKIKIKSINYISNNDEINQNNNFSQTESYRQYKVYKYVSPSKNLFNNSNNFIHKTWTNNFLYKKKNSFNNSTRKIKQYPKIVKDEDSDDE